jgi:hypothetical protein
MTGRVAVYWFQDAIARGDYVIGFKYKRKRRYEKEERIEL